MKIFTTLSAVYTVITFIATVLLICLKTDGLIDWSWWWVFAPLWASFAVALLLVVAVSLIVLFKLVRDEK